jgi:hypothetical protein
VTATVTVLVLLAVAAVMLAIGVPGALAVATLAVIVATDDLLKRDAVSPNGST